MFRVKAENSRQLLDGWLSWASHSRIPEFVHLAQRIRAYCYLIYDTLDHGSSNARSEAALPTRGGTLSTTTRPSTVNRTHSYVSGSGHL